MSSHWGNCLHISIFGQSHAPAIGVTLDNLPAGQPIDLEALHAFLARRAPGRGPTSTPRKEADQPEILCGLVNGFTCGAPLSAVIRNTNTRSQDYENLRDMPRPGHADYTAQIKYRGFQDLAGGGHFSGRLTAPLCIAGGICLQILKRQGPWPRSKKVQKAGLDGKGKNVYDMPCNRFVTILFLSVTFREEPRRHDHGRFHRPSG